LRGPPKSPPIPKAFAQTTTTTGSGISFPIEPTITDNGDTWTGTQTLDLSTGDGHVYKWTVDQNLTFASAVSNIPTSGTQRTFELEFEHDGVGGTFTVTLPNNFADEQGNSLTSFDITSGTVILSCRINDGTNFLVLQKNVKAVTSNFSGNLSDLVIDTHFDADGTYRFVYDTDADSYTVATTDDQIEHYTGGFERMRLTNTELQLQGGVNMNLNGNDLIFGTGVGEFMDHGAATNIRVYTGSTHRLTWNATGQLMESGYRLTMEDEIRFTGITKPGTNTSNKIYAEDLTNDQLVLNTVANGEIRFDENGTEFARFGGGETQIGSAIGYNLNFLRDDATPSDNDQIVNVNFQGNNSIGTPLNFARIRVTQTDVTSGTEDGDIDFFVYNGGTLDNILRLDGNVLTIDTLGNPIDLGGGDLDDIGLHITLAHVPLDYRHPIH
jgi:hypothetical protein